MTFLLCVMYILLFALATIINYLLTYLHEEITPRCSAPNHHKHMAMITSK